MTDIYTLSCGDDRKWRLWAEYDGIDETTCTFEDTGEYLSLDCRGNQYNFFVIPAHGDMFFVEEQDVGSGDVLRTPWVSAPDGIYRSLTRRFEDHRIVNGPDEDGSVVVRLDDETLMVYRKMTNEYGPYDSVVPRKYLPSYSKLDDASRPNHVQNTRAEIDVLAVRSGDSWQLLSGELLSPSFEEIGEVYSLSSDRWNLIPDERYTLEFDGRVFYSARTAERGWQLHLWDEPATSFGCANRVIEVNTLLGDFICIRGDGMQAMYTGGRLGPFVDQISNCTSDHSWADYELSLGRHLDKACLYHLSGQKVVYLATLEGKKALFRGHENLTGWLNPGELIFDKIGSDYGYFIKRGSNWIHLDP
jgi:hypothetical protein